MLIAIEKPCPILNTSDFSFAFGGKTGREIPLNERMHPYCFEFVALQGMLFKMEEALPKKESLIYRVSCPFYSGKDLFLDSRFVGPAKSPHPREIPPASLILQRMKDRLGIPYVWGGNWSQGIPEMLLYYPAPATIDDRTYALWTLSGVDCSGLLFEAADGTTPRNTSELLQFGSVVPIGADLQPLDMILFPGHVLFVLDSTTIIESKFPFGVICRNLSIRLWELDRERRRVNEWTADLPPQKHYIVRRFFHCF